MTAPDPRISSPIGLIAGGGMLPFAVADSLIARNITPMLFALKGACDPAEVTRFRHHWIAIGQLGRLKGLLRAENCRELVFIGLGHHPGHAQHMGCVSWRRRSSAVRDRRDF
jgi:DUF1009 family protein